jgi:hypothetical protein
MDMLLLGITVVSLIVAFIMSMAAMRLMRDEKQRSSARVAALSLAAGSGDETMARAAEPRGSAIQDYSQELPKPAPKAPWSAPKIVPAIVPAPVAQAAPVAPVLPAVPPVAPELPLNQPRIQTERYSSEEVGITHASGFLGAGEVQREEGGRQKTLAFAAAVMFVVLSGGLVFMMSGPRGTTAQAMGPNAPLELVSLSHQRQNTKLAVSGLVRNPATGKPIDKLSAVVFLFDRTGTFVTSSRANVDFLKLGAGDESPFVVSLDAPATVARYRVSFRTDEGIVPHIDRRSATPVTTEGEQPLNVSVK